MERQHLEANSPALDSESELEGASMAPPAFQLQASSQAGTHPPALAPIQRQVKAGSTLQLVRQPVITQASPNTMSIGALIGLIEAEEQKYPEAEQLNTSLMITRIRKIWYGAPSWDEHLINGVENVDSPYGAPRTRERGRRTVEMPLLGDDFDMVDTETYPVNPDGTEPEIYSNQEVALPDGTFIDIGHVFAGLDAHNHRHDVDASSLMTITIDNLDGVTWVGDLGSVLAEVQIDFINGGELRTDAEVQARIDEYASPQDMIGNIDAYAIAESYDISSSGNRKISQILRHYYLGEGVQQNQSRRYQLFAQSIGLTGWNGSGWSNESDRLDHYTDQVNDAAAMYIGAGSDSGWNPVSWLASRSGAVGMSTNAYARTLVQAFFRTLRSLRSTE